MLKNNLVISLVNDIMKDGLNEIHLNRAIMLIDTYNETKDVRIEEYIHILLVLLGLYPMRELLNDENYKKYQEAISNSLVFMMVNLDSDDLKSEDTNVPLVSRLSQSLFED